MWPRGKEGIKRAATPPLCRVTKVPPNEDQISERSFGQTRQPALFVRRGSIGFGRLPPSEQLDLIARRVDSTYRASGHRRLPASQRRFPVQVLLAVRALTRAGA